MKIYICENVFVPLRAGPTHRSEMLSQILFGEKYRLTDTSGTWLKIEIFLDKYTGIDKKPVINLPMGDINEYKKYLKTL